MYTPNCDLERETIKKEFIGKIRKILCFYILTDKKENQLD